MLEASPQKSQNPSFYFSNHKNIQNFLKGNDNDKGDEELKKQNISFWLFICLAMYYVVFKKIMFHNVCSEIYNPGFIFPLPP